MSKKILIILILILGVLLYFAINKEAPSECYYPEWAVNARYNQPVKVLDTESALGRYATKTKEISLKDLALIHGHLCDGLVISYVEIKAVLNKFFSDGVVDRKWLYNSENFYW